MRNIKIRGASTLIIAIISILLVIGAIILSKIQRKSNSVSRVLEKTTRVITRKDGFSFDKDTPGYENYLSLMQGCSAGKDCIVSIDNPTFEPINIADSWIADNDVVFVLTHGGVTRAYPQKILNRHEIVNDTILNDSILVTFCPLCGSAIAFDRTINTSSGSIVSEFGVSGKLHNTDLVMYDRVTESLWQQITGEAIVGELFGKKLTQIPLSSMRWVDFKGEFVKAEVLSRPSKNNYDYYPYGDYEENSGTIFPVEGGVDNTIFPKTVVYGVEVDNFFKAYPEDKLKERESKFIDRLGGTEIGIDYNGGNIQVTRLDNGKQIPATRLFWFAWKAFRSETELY